MQVHWDPLGSERILLLGLLHCFQPYPTTSNYHPIPRKGNKHQNETRRDSQVPSLLPTICGRSILSTSLSVRCLLPLARTTGATSTTYQIETKPEKKKKEERKKRGREKIKRKETPPSAGWECCHHVGYYDTEEERGYSHHHRQLEVNLLPSHLLGYQGHHRSLDAIPRHLLLRHASAVLARQNPAVLCRRGLPVQYCLCKSSLLFFLFSSFVFPLSSNSGTHPQWRVGLGWVWFGPGHCYVMFCRGAFTPPSRAPAPENVDPPSPGPRPSMDLAPVRARSVYRHHKRPNFQKLGSLPTSQLTAVGSMHMWWFFFLRTEDDWDQPVTFNSRTFTLHASTPTHPHPLQSITQPYDPEKSELN